MQNKDLSGGTSLGRQLRKTTTYLSIPAAADMASSVKDARLHSKKELNKSMAVVLLHWPYAKPTVAPSSGYGGEWRKRG